MTPFSDDPYLRGTPIVGAVAVPDAAEWPVLAPGQVVFVRGLRPRGANYFEQVFALRYEDQTLVRHVHVLGSACRIWGSNPDFAGEAGRVLDLPPAPGWPRPDWPHSGRLRPDLRLLGPVVYPYRFAYAVQFGTPRGRETPPVFFAWSN